LSGRRKSEKGKSGKRRKENVKERSGWAQVKALGDKDEDDGKAEGEIEVGEEVVSSGSTFEDNKSFKKRRRFRGTIKMVEKSTLGLTIVSVCQVVTPLKLPLGITSRYPDPRVTAAVK
jgi:hypothetical protein